MRLWHQQLQYLRITFANNSPYAILDLGIYRHQLMLKVNLNEEKPKIKKKRRWKKLVFYPLLFIFSFVSIFLIDYFFFSGSSLFSRDNIIRAVTNGSDLLGKVLNTELKNEDYVTSALIVGIDTRNVILEDGEFKSTSPQGQSGTRNTDTIIQVVYDHKDESLTFISIPRDLGVDYVQECLEFHGSIHWVYDKTQAAGCPGGGVQGLIDTVESVTGIPIQYYSFVTLDSFIEAIETVGEINPETGETGIYVDNPTDVWDVYPYNDYGWENVFFKQGRIFLTGEDALKYVRSRQLTSDFGRARRQQILIEAVMQRVLSSETFLNPDKLSSLYNIYQQKTLVSEVSIKELLAAVDILETFSLENDVNIILDPSLGGKEAYLNKQPHDRPGGPYYMVPTHWKECGEGKEFCRVQSLIQNIKTNPKVYAEEAVNFAYATNYVGGKLDFTLPAFDNFLSSDPPVFVTKSSYKITPSQSLAEIGGVVVIDFSQGLKPETKAYFEAQEGFTMLDGADYANYRLNKEDFTILVLSE